MSLEQNIQELNTSIQQLITAMSTFASQPVSNLALQVVQDVATEQATKVTANQPEPVTIAELKQTVNCPEQLRCDIQKLSANLIAEKITTRDILRTMLVDYKGALVLKDVPDANLEELKARILALGA